MTHSFALAAESSRDSPARAVAGRRPAARHRASSASSFALLCLLGLQLSAQACDDWHAEFVQVDGLVEVRLTEEGAWQAAEDGMYVCRGTLIRVGEFGRATLRLHDGSLFKLDANSSLRLSAPQDDGSVIELIRGIIHVISRDPRSLRFDTPYANAGLEGTEFDIEVTASGTAVTVIEGEVLLRNAVGEVRVPTGQRGIASPSDAPQRSSATNPFERAEWTPYFVPLLDRPLPAPDATASSTSDAEFFAHRAAARLRVGRPDAASEDIVQALRRDPASAAALALGTLLELVEGERARARESATRAVELGPSEAAPLLALSYVQQAELDRTAAAESAQRAVSLEPSNAIAWARLAELRLETGEYLAGLSAANRALEIDPTLGAAQTVLGFALLMQTEAGAAEAAFRRAIEYDGASPLPRLGLALALIRQNQLEPAREAMEIAVILDPRNPKTRSYMARVYAAEQRLALNDTQLDIARLLAPDDPTPYYYETLTRQSENRPVEALRSFRTATALNDGTPLYRSTLKLDEDLAARSAGIGSLHRTLGFEQLAINAGLESIAADAADHTGHRLIADVYSTLPRHQIARINELFMSQMLQPINVTPIQAQLAEPNLFVLDNTGPRELAYSEFGPSLSRNGVAWQLSGIAAGHGTRGTDFTVAGLADHLSYSLGYFDFESDGFRPNNDIDQRVANAFLQYRVDANTSVQGELRSNRTQQGDLALFFDPGAYNPSQRQHQEIDTARLGVRHDLASDSTLLGSVIYERVEAGAQLTGYAASARAASYSFDLRHIWSAPRFTLNSGAQGFRQRRHERVRQQLVLPTPPFEIDLDETTHVPVYWASLYAYLDYAISDRVVGSVGLSATGLRADNGRHDQLNPKLGLTWKPTTRTSVRLASFRTLQGPLVAKRGIQPRLEPTHVGGFNQYFFGAVGDQAWRHAVRVDHEASESLFGGVELSTRALDRLVFLLVPDGTLFDAEQGIDEYFYRAYLYWAPDPNWSFAAEYRHETIDAHDLPVPEGYTRIRTRQLPLQLNFFHRHGLSSRLEARYVDQSGTFTPMTFGAPDVASRGEDAFWTFAASLHYRLPARRGTLSLDIENLLDEPFRFQDLDPENPSIVPERTVSLRFSLAY